MVKEIDENNLSKYAESNDPIPLLVADKKCTVSKKRTTGKISDVWGYIDTITDYDGNETFSCKLCKSNHIEKSWNSRNTDTFRKHLLKEHSGIYSPNESKKTPQQTGFVASKKLKRTTNEIFAKYDKEYTDSKLLCWILNHAQPFNIVEQSDFVNFCNALRGEYVLPCRNTIKNHIMKRWTDSKVEMRKIIVEETSSCKVVLTTEMWISAAKRGYMVVTMHYIGISWEMKSVIIGFIQVFYPHSAMHLARILYETVCSIDKHLLKRIWIVTADNVHLNREMAVQFNILRIENLSEYNGHSHVGSDDNDEDDSLNFTNAAENKFEFLTCFAHMLQLAIEEATRACPIMDSAIETFRYLVNEISCSPTLAEVMQEICLELKVPFLNIELDCDLRWNSTWSMLNLIIEHMREPMEELLRRICKKQLEYTSSSINLLAHKISSESWSAAEYYCSFLSVFKDATELMSASTYPTLGMIIPVFKLIMDHIKETKAAISGKELHHFRKFAAIIDHKITEYYREIVMPITIISAVLDPRSKSCLIQCGIPMEQQRNEVLKAFECGYRNRYCKTVASAHLASQTRSISKESAFFVKFLKLGGQADVNTDRSLESFEAELDRWMNDSSMDFEQSSHDVFHWFKVNEKFYPRIALMARDYLAATATSISSEFAFSKACNQILLDRERLDDILIQYRMELQSWANFL